MPNAFVLKAVDNEIPGYSVPGVWKSLKDGKARIGWSYADNLDLRLIQQKIRASQDLNDDESKAWRCRAFLEDMLPGDYILYPHQPEYGRFAVVRIIPEGGYAFAEAADSLEGDFRSYRLCELLTPNSLSWRDTIVRPLLKRKLGLQGRLYRLYEVELVEQMLRDLPDQGTDEPDSNKLRIARIAEAIHVQLPGLLQEQFPAHDLSRRLCRELFEKMGYSVQVQEGSTEAGSDLIVTIRSALIPDEHRVGVQAFSYIGEISQVDLQVKLDQLLAGWETNKLDYGVLLTTGLCGPEAAAVVKDYNKKPQMSGSVSLIDGRVLADLFLEHFGTSLRLPRSDVS